MDLTNVNTLKDLLASYSIYPSKSKGQNFLISREALEEIVKVADLQPEDLVVEIGPGVGVLTRELAARVKKVLAVELDRPLIKVLKQTLRDFNNVEILEGDILHIKNQELAERLKNQKIGDSQGYKVVANLPYNLTGRVIKKFLSYDPKPQAMTLLLQKEVVERILAKPGGMSLLAVSAQLYSRPESGGIITRENFYPEPEVDSAIVNFKNINTDFLRQNGLDEKKFWQIVRIGFASRRKQLQNNLAGGLKKDKEEVKNILIKAKFDLKCRAEDLAVKDWLKLTKLF
jgi:16S rRNA (adenine1518-N6/adenine1519-N6)-dimethyltransferase